jgi:hypothetical protein
MRDVRFASSGIDEEASGAVDLFLSLVTCHCFWCAAVAQSVERVLGKDEVTSSILVCGSRDPVFDVLSCE